MNISMICWNEEGLRYMKLNHCPFQKMEIVDDTLVVTHDNYWVTLTKVTDIFSIEVRGDE